MTIIPSQQWDPQEPENIWRLLSTKRLEIIPISMRLLFQMTFPSGKRRGVGISWNAFSKVKDVSLRPYQAVVVSLEDAFLNNHGNKTIHLIKYWNSKDKKRCAGGQFFFTLEEWSHFWRHIFEDIYNYVNR